MGPFGNAFETLFSKILILFLLNLFFFFLDLFDVLISKIIFKNKKIYYFDAFPSKKHFEKQPLLHFQTTSMSAPISWSVFNLLASTIGPKIYISS
jgi:UDP-N-acetylmuramyl pentapeptide phosphotransferase/UDP-N-acetylglucosamine-1-phosphate transferase